jgi:hypothetical protein
MPYPHPDLPTMFDFISENNSLAGVQVSHEEISKTHQKKLAHPAAIGHFSALFYAYELLHKPHFLYRHPLDFADEKHSNKALFWLRDVHQKLMAPIAQQGEFFPAFSELIRFSDCGNYRLNAHSAGMDRKLPQPKHIQALLFHWYKDLCDFDRSLTNCPNDSELHQRAQMAELKNIQLQCIKPFEDGTGRTARIMENVLRLRWGLPWKIHRTSQNILFVKNLMTYEDGPEWQKLLYFCQ